MPQVKGMRLGRIKAQPPLPNNPTPFKKKRRQPISQKILLSTTEDAPSEPILTQQDQAELRLFRYALNQCNEGACLCTCLCHMGSGPGACDSDEPTPFHFRTPNTAHKRTHRECPKGDTHKW